MSFKKLAVLVFLVGLAAAAFFYRDTLGSRLNGFVDRLSQDRLLPPPLRGPFGEGGSLTTAGVIEQTNIQREREGGSVLRENTQLNEAAEIKLQDMFAQQYFEHISPEGQGPSDLAKEVGYQYIVVGENLAVGNFRNDQDLVEAWMNSPGHRANILHERYQDIGVAVGQGRFEGRTVWMAVQEFGTLLSVCPQPSLALKTQIDSSKIHLAALQAQLSALKAQIDSGAYRDEEYNRKVEQYNAVVRQANALIDKIRGLVAEYNAEANRFNACVNQ